MFNKELASQLNNYVYRLIDPRTGNTFYVGRGKGNRIFAHVKGALLERKYKNLVQEGEDETSAKIKTIREINSLGLEVIHIIHRWGLNDKEAKEVESALIDAYPGLDNINSGYASDRGTVTTYELITSSDLNELVIKDKFIIIKIQRNTHIERGNYEATRSSWKLNIDKARLYPYVLSVINGVVIEVYEVIEWNYNLDRPGRIFFSGKIAPVEIRDRYINKRIPMTFRKKGLATPTLYSDKDE